MAHQYRQWRDVPVQQVPGCQISTLFMVDTDHVGIDTVQLPVNDHQRRTYLGKATCNTRVATHRRNNQPVHALFQQHAQITTLFLRIIIGVAEDHAKTVALAVILDAPRQLGEIRVHAVGNQQADGRGGLGLQRTRHCTGHIIELCNGGFDLEPDRLAHRPGIVQHVETVVYEIPPWPRHP